MPGRITAMRALLIGVAAVLMLCGAVLPAPAQEQERSLETIMDYYGENGFLTPESHERFADAHLLYLKEGKAPSEELRPAFQRFSRWLSKIWGTVKAGMVAVT